VALHPLNRADALDRFGCRQRFEDQPLNLVTRSPRQLREFLQEAPLVPDLHG
jgi:hypothetical protein